MRLALEALERAGRVTRGEFRPEGVDREWCEVEVLRALRRRSLAALRHEVEPVESDVLARFLPQWQGIGRRGPGSAGPVRRHGFDALVEVLGQLQGAPVAASVLERDVLPARLAGYRSAELDELCAAGEVVWVGAGAVGARDGRLRLAFRDQAALLVPPGDGEAPDDPTHLALREHLADRGASFWPELVGAVAAAGLPYDDTTVLTALWDLVWAGEVTNDTLAPVRAMLASGSARGGRRSGGRRPAGRPRPGRLARLGPPAGAGRWSLVAPLLEPRPEATAAAHARALQLLERYGVLTREAALGEGAEGGFAGVYPVLRALEERGKVRRGYFVAGLGAAQFALPGAVDRLRDCRRPVGERPEEHGLDAAALAPGFGGGAPGAVAEPGPDGLVLAATDPAQPYGAALPWPEPAGTAKPARAVGAHVALVDGAVAAYVERGGRSLVTFPPAEGFDGVDDAEVAHVLAAAVKDGRLGALEVAKVDGEPAAGSALAEHLRASGFVDGYKGLTLRP